MLNRNTYTSLALILALAVSPAVAAETEAEPHQPSGAAANANSMPGCMMSEAEGGMPMIQMMMGQDGMRMIAKHIEGRLAFLIQNSRSPTRRYLSGMSLRRQCGTARRRCRPCRTR